MGRQSARIYFQKKDHKDIYYNGHYHDAMYIGDKLVWEKLKFISVIDSLDQIYVPKIVNNEVVLTSPYSPQYIYLREYRNRRLETKSVVEVKPIVEDIINNSEKNFSGTYMMVSDEYLLYCNDYFPRGGSLFVAYSNDAKEFKCSASDIYPINWKNYFPKYSLSLRYTGSIILNGILLIPKSSPSKDSDYLIFNPYFAAQIADDGTIFNLQQKAFSKEAQYDYYAYTGFAFDKLSDTAYALKSGIKTGISTNDTLEICEIDTSVEVIQSSDPYFNGKAVINVVETSTIMHLDNAYKTLGGYVYNINAINGFIFIEIDGKGISYMVNVDTRKLIKLDVNISPADTYYLKEKALFVSILPGAIGTSKDGEIWNIEDHSELNNIISIRYNSTCYEENDGIYVVVQDVDKNIRLVRIMLNGIGDD